MRMVHARDQSEQVHHINEADFELWEVLTQERSSGQTFVS
jgi:hypothetical protein